MFDQQISGTGSITFCKSFAHIKYAECFLSLSFRLLQSGHDKGLWPVWTVPRTGCLPPGSTLFRARFTDEDYDIMKNLGLRIQ
jgi:hypothetical protein